MVLLQLAFGQALLRLRVLKVNQWKRKLPLVRLVLSSVVAKLQHNPQVKLVGCVFGSNENASVAQLDRASVFGTEGWGFESLRACFQKSNSD